MASCVSPDPVLQTPQELYNQLQSPSNLILVDCRSIKEHTKESVRTSINIDWLNLSEEYKGNLADVKAKRFALRKHFNVFLYDSCDYTACSVEERNIGPAWGLLAAIRREGQAKEPVYLLSEGFGKFRDKYSYLVRGHPMFLTDILPAEIIPGRLYLGCLADGKNKVTHNALGIRAVVNCTMDEDFFIEGEQNQFRVAVDDSCNQDIQEYFPGALEFMRKHAKLGNAILVHCMMGMSRSASMVLLYLMHENNMSLKQCYDQVKRQRPCINPNPKFLKELERNERALRGSATIRFKEGEILTVSSVYDWLVGDEWVQRNVLTKPK